jgi:hypothetical protein
MEKAFCEVIIYSKERILDWLAGRARAGMQLIPVFGFVHDGDVALSIRRHYI